MTTIKDNVLSAFTLLWALEASDMKLQITLYDLVSVPGVSKVHDLFALGHPIEVGFFGYLPVRGECDDECVLEPKNFDLTVDPKVLAKSILVALDPRFEQWDLDTILTQASQDSPEGSYFMHTPERHSDHHWSSLYFGPGIHPADRF